MESEAVRAECNRQDCILEADYQAADLNNIIERYLNLVAAQKAKLLPLLKTFDHLFDGTLSKWNTEPVHLAIRSGIKPFLASPFLFFEPMKIS